MSDPDAFSTLPMPPRSNEPSTHEPLRFVALALRSSESSRRGWEQLRLRLSQRE